MKNGCARICLRDGRRSGSRTRIERTSEEASAFRVEKARQLEAKKPNHPSACTPTFVQPVGHLVGAVEDELSHNALVVIVKRQ